MQVRLLSFFFLALSGCTPSDEIDARISVSNLNVGLMRETVDGRWHVYSRGTTFPLKPNGTCEADGKTRDCMWYGLEFDFEPENSRATLSCEASFNKKTDIVEPRTQGTPKVETTTFEIPLEGYKGHIAMPAAVFALPDDTKDPWTVRVECSHYGQEVLRYSFTALHEA
jgi:hypothetical protein